MAILLILMVVLAVAAIERGSLIALGLVGLGAALFMLLLNAPLAAGIQVVVIVGIVLIIKYYLLPNVKRPTKGDINEY